MRRAKSFNDEGSGIPRAMLAGFLAGAAADLVILPAVWSWLVPAVGGVVDAVLRTLSPASPTPPSGAMATPRLENPLAALPGILSGGQRSAFLLAALGVLALCITIALANRISRTRWIHDGTWVGGRRAPGAPIHGDARLASGPSELRRLTSGWREGKGPRGGTLAVGVLGGEIRLIDSVHACILAESGEGVSATVKTTNFAIAL